MTKMLLKGAVNQRNDIVTFRRSYAQSETRTRTMLPSGDFESPASTDSAIRANGQIYPFHTWRTTEPRKRKTP